MNSDRPNPDRLLNAVRDSQSSRGRLRIYLGYAAGVGKSYAMLKNAQALKSMGKDVVVGYIEVHGRNETEFLLEGLEQIPPKEINVAGATLKEFDIDAALKRNPAILLVDEMAHTNAEGSRHLKRWQDIQELLSAGIDVHTTLNIQHLASLNDVIAQITGVIVRETVPDQVFNKASEVTLIDITPDELLIRLKAGKVYRAAQAEQALGNYFKKSNLVALREIALRRTAERVHADVDEERLTSNIQTIIPTQERLACLVEGDEASAVALRATARTAGLMQCPWWALAVTGAVGLTRMPSSEKRYEHQLVLAEELGGKVARISGALKLPEIVRWVRAENITKLFIARPHNYNFMRWFEALALFFGSGVDIVWVRTSAATKTGAKEDFDVKENKDRETKNNFRITPYLQSSCIVLGSFLVAAVLGFIQTHESNITLVYLLGVIIAAITNGEGASAWAAFLSAFILAFGLTHFEWRASWMNTEYLLTFGLNLGIGLLASQMTLRLRQQAEIARRQRELAESLYLFTSQLSSSHGLHQVAASAQTQLKDIFGYQVWVMLPLHDSSHFRPVISNISNNTSNNSPVPINAKNTSFNITSQKPVSQTPDIFSATSEQSLFAVADWAASHAQPAGAGTQTLPRSPAVFLPLKGTQGVVGILAVFCGKETPDLSLYEKFVTPLAAKIESMQIAENAENIYWQAERERLRSDLFRAVSEGIKTPLTILATMSSGLLSGKIPASAQNEVLLNIHEEASRLQRLIDNLTQLTRFEVGQLSPQMEKTDLNEFLRNELFRLEPLTSRHNVVFKPCEGVLSVYLSQLLFSQALHNIVENAAQYSPMGSRITLLTQKSGKKSAHILIEDEGDGIPAGELEKIFEKYYRLSSRTHGAGLGLTVSRAIAEAHSARIWAENISPRGLRVIIELPLQP